MNNNKHFYYKKNILNKINIYKTTNHIYGSTGATGINGPNGLIGPTGMTGIIGLIGPTGSTGPIGKIGLIGSQGKTGLIGQIGETGYTGYQGYIGLTGLIGPTGLRGLLGMTGLLGNIGPNGNTGYTGFTGPLGFYGYTGTPGIIGSTGYIDLNNYYNKKIMINLLNYRWLNNNTNNGLNMPSSSNKYYGVKTGTNEMILFTNNPENGKMSLLINGNVYADGIYTLDNNNYNNKVGFNYVYNNLEINSNIINNNIVNFNNNIYGFTASFEYLEINTLYGHSIENKAKGLAFYNWNNISNFNNNDNYGDKITLSGDGNIIAISNYITNNSGIIKIYKYNNNNWTQLGNNIIGNINEQIGYSISLSYDGYTIIFCSYIFGFIKIYRYNNINWIQIGSTINDNINKINTVSISNDGNIIAFSSIQYNNYSGYVKIYKYNEIEWIQLGKIITNNDSKQFGYSISLSSNGNKIAIGANGINENNDSGYVSIFNYIDNNWIQIGNNIYGKTSTDKNGESISLSSDGYIVAIGSPLYDNNNIWKSGIVRVFKYSNNWVQIGNDITDNYNQSNSGKSISLSGDGTIISIGIPNGNNPSNQNISGKVKIYKFNGIEWINYGNTIIENTISSFGNIVSISKNGNILAIGGGIINANNNKIIKIYKLNYNDVYNIYNTNIPTNDLTDGLSYFNTNEKKLKIYYNGQWY